MVEFATTRHLDLAYEVSGPEDGAPVVAVHGWPDGPDTWSRALDRLHDGGCRVYRPYLRGFGPTRFRDGVASRSGQVAALARDVLELLDALELQDVVLAGHDWGARLGYALAALHPDRVAGLLAISVAYGATGSDAPPAPEQAHAYWYQWYFATRVGRIGLVDDRLAICRHLWKTWTPWRAAEEEFERTAALWNNPDWHDVTVHSYAHRWGEAEGDPDLAADEEHLAATPPISVPTIVLHGEEDGATLASATEGQEKHFTSHHERRVLPGVGHFVPREAPTETARAILELVAFPRAS